MKITTDYPGGNCKLISITEENGKTVVNLEQELRDTSDWWFYWNFRVDNPPEGEVIFAFHNKDVVCSHGPATSTDAKNWEWCEEKSFIDHTHFRYVFSENEPSRYFCFTIPYLTADFELFYEKIKNDSAVTRSVLTESEKGRQLPLLTFGNGKRDILFTARHHCCESTASYVLDGVISSILEKHRELLDSFRFHIVPFTDIDGVEQGDQGKNRAPHDHNRDYTEEPIYNYTKAIYKYSENFDLACFIDFHSPWSWGGANDEPHIHFGPSVEPTPDLQELFSEMLNKITVSDSRNVIRYNCVTTHYGDNANHLDTPNSKNFFKFKRKSNIAFTVETPYSGNLKNGYTVSQLHIFGEHIAQALSECLNHPELD